MEKRNKPQRVILRTAKDIGQHPIIKRMEDYLGDFFGEIKISNYSLKSLGGPAELSVGEMQKLVVQEILDRVNKIEAWEDKFVAAIEIITDSQAIAEALYESFRVGEIHPLLIIAVFEGEWKKGHSPSPKKDEDGRTVFSHYSTFRFIQGNFQELKPLCADSQNEDI